HFVLLFAGVPSPAAAAVSAVPDPASAGAFVAAVDISGRSSRFRCLAQPDVPSSAGHWDEPGRQAVPRSQTVAEPFPDWPERCTDLLPGVPAQPRAQRILPACQWRQLAACRDSPTPSVPDFLARLACAGFVLRPV